jgi:peptidylprolyl isomerase
MPRKKKQKATPGTFVTLHYKGTLEDGSEFDSSHSRGEPMTVAVGQGHLIKGFDDALQGMAKGETKTFTIPASEAYGDPDPEATTVMEKSLFPPDFEFSEGLVVPLAGPDGNPFPAVITEISETTITADLNHPMAGKDLTFEVEVLEIADELPAE